MNNEHAESWGWLSSGNGLLELWFLMCGSQIPLKWVSRPASVFQNLEHGATAGVSPGTFYQRDHCQGAWETQQTQEANDLRPDMLLRGPCFPHFPSSVAEPTWHWTWPLQASAWRDSSRCSAMGRTTPKGSWLLWLVCFHYGVGRELTAAVLARRADPNGINEKCVAGGLWYTQHGLGKQGPVEIGNPFLASKLGTTEMYIQEIYPE